tara:strand:- start:3208 stop:4014 length:807 start_codon:yes stop_codon:yes gene_type:complete
MPNNIKLEHAENNVGADGFASVENKGVLWDLMYTNGTFQGLSPNTVENVKQLFENVIRENEASSGSKKAKNKRVLVSMTQRIYAMKQAPVSANVPGSAPANAPVTAGELSAQRRSEFDNNLSNRQKDFDDLVQKPVPKQIDFSDSTESDKPLPDDMDRMINDVIAKRERDFNMVSSEQPSNTELKIGSVIAGTDITNLDGEDNNNNNKRVSFAHDRAQESAHDSAHDSAQDSAHDSVIASLHQLIRTIDEKQDKIMSMLKTLTNSSDV